MNVVVLHQRVPDDASAAERDVLAQCEAVHGSLQRLGHNVRTLACDLQLQALRQSLEELRPAAVFNLVESINGTDRLAPLVTLLLDTLQIPYSGSPTETIMLASDKLRAKRFFAEHAIHTPRWWLPEQGWLPRSAPPALAPAIDTVIVKAVWEHASFYMSDDSVLRVPDAWSDDDMRAWLRTREQIVARPLFVEEFIDGREFNLSLLAGTSPPEVLPAAEIEFHSLPPEQPRIVGQAAKWDLDSMEYHHTPRRFAVAVDDHELIEELKRIALRCWQHLGIRGYARVDFRVAASGQPYVLEINTNPCLSPDAGFAAALAEAGIHFDAAVARILDDAVGHTSATWPNASKGLVG